MAKRDKLGRFFGPHDPRQTRDAQNVALLRCAFRDMGERLGCHGHMAARDGDAGRRGLVGDIDHMGPAFTVEM